MAAEDSQKPGNDLTEVNQGGISQSAMQSIAQSSAIALSDATDNLRNLNTLSTTAIGVALSKLLDTGDMKYVDMLPQVQKVVSDGANNFDLVGSKINKIFQYEKNKT